jgi:hypothetical protein
MAIAEIFPPTLPDEPGARGFQKGHAKIGGRRKGGRNRFRAAIYARRSWLGSPRPAASRR